MTAPDRPLVGDDRIEELVRGVIEPLLLQAKDADDALHDPARWVVPPSMTAEELAQKLAEAIRQAIREAGEAAALTVEPIRYDLSAGEQTRFFVGKTAAEMIRRRVYASLPAKE